MQGSLRSIIKQYVKYYGKLPVVLVLIAIGIVLLNFILGKAVLNSQDEVIDELSSRSEELRLRVDAKQSGKGISAERVAGIKADLRSYKDSFIKEAEITSLISDVDKAASK
ncbi:MAG: hypothetical protein KAR06_11855, partial [Deltaproteobacteria bacterium]|nr:hypothetical protein [Deltaproteobacteria bacterium]